MTNISRKVNVNVRHLPRQWELWIDFRWRRLSHD